ncbi:MAG: PAS domain S-box protein, partial [Promethearchaeota archaeon]
NILILSHHNPYFRPKIFFKVPESVESEESNQIPTLLELYDKGFFVHTFGSIISANLIFRIRSEYSPGKIERLMISIVIDNKSKFNMTLSQELLERFANELKKIEEGYKAFYTTSNVYEGDPAKLTEINELLFNFYKSLPEENIIFERKDARILIYGLSQAGKTTIIKCRRKSIFKNTPPTISVDISRIIINNISLLTYDTPGYPKYRELWKPYLKGQDGLIFVLDINDRIKFPDARDLLHTIAHMPEMSELPLLIMFNKIDLIDPNIEYLTQAMDLDKLGGRPIKYFLTSAVKNINIDDAFNWLALQISERVYPKPKSDLGVIFASWDENIGVKVIAVHPSEAFDDPELVAVRCFSISQFIFGHNEFKKISVLLPLPHLNAKAAIFFDYIIDEQVRGEALPLCLILYCNEKVPRAILDQFNSYIFEKFDQIKEYYLNKSYVQTILQEIHNTINNKLMASEPTVEALKIAELRYQALFKAARDAIFIIDRKSGIIVDANEQTEKLLLLPAEDIIGMHISQLKLEDENGDFMNKILNQIQMEISHPIEISIINSQNNKIPVEINTSQVQMGGQNLIQCILRDITERKQTQRKLRDSEKKYRHLFENSPFSIILINSKGRITDCNPAMEDLLGYKREELLDKKFIDLSIVHQNHLLLLFKRFKAEIRNVILPLLDVQLFKKDGGIIWTKIQTSFAIIKNETFFQIIAYDITTQKNIEEDIKNIIKFERILSIISPQFVGAKDISNAINKSLLDIGRLSSLSRVYIYLLDKDRKTMKVSYEWCDEDVIQIKENFQEIDLKNYPWLLKNLQNKDCIYIKNVSELPEEAINIKYLMENGNTASSLIYPIQINQDLAGFIAFDNVEKPKDWKYENIELLSIFPELIGISLEKQQSELELLESRERYHNEYDRANFYRELFIHDVNNIFKNIQSNIDIFSKEEDLQKLINIKFLIKNIKQKCFEAEKLVTVIRKLTQIEESKLPLKHKEIIKIINNAIENVKNDNPEKELTVNFDSPFKEVYVLANDYLIDVFEDILISSVKYTEKIMIHINIVLTKIQYNDKSYLKLTFIDNQSLISDISKEKILMREDSKNEKIRGLLLGFLLIERILESVNGRLSVEEDNFTVLIPVLP